jgi:hypothetical protein
MEKQLDHQSIRDHPLLTPTMLCIEGTAAVVRGELGDSGMPAVVDNIILCMLVE